MSTNSEQADGGEEVSFGELREMTREEAAERLDQHDLERWEAYHELRSRKEETAERFQDDDALAIDTLVQADMGELTTDLDLYGNEVSVVIELDERQQSLLRNVEREYDDIDLDDPGEDAIDAVRDVMERFIATVVVGFNGVEVRDLEEVKRLTLAAECVDKWGLRGTFHAVVKIVEATREMDEDRVGSIESFRPEARGRAGRGAPHDGA